MTIEAVKDVYGTFDITTRRTRVLEYRSWEHRVTPTTTFVGSPSVEMTHSAHVLDDERRPGDFWQFIHPLSERNLMVVTKTNLLESGEKKMLVGEEINRANIKLLGGERVIYRATRPGDYPPLKPGQVDTTERAHLQNGIEI